MQGRITVIGAGGFLGQALVAELLAAGASVAGIGRHLPADWPAGAMFHICDATRPARLQAAIGDSTGVINAMAGPPAAMLGVARSLVHCQEAGWHGRLVHLSSQAVFGQAAGTFHETSPPAPAPGHAYAAAKRAGETLLGAGPGAAQTIILRPGCLYGPGAPVWVDRLCRLLLARRLGWLWDEGAGRCPLVHVNDAARAAIAALHAGPLDSGVHHLVCPETLTWNAYITNLATCLGLTALPRMSCTRLDLETYLHSPARVALASLGVPDAGPLTPAMRRLFRSQAHIVAQRRPLIPPESQTSLQTGIAQAVADFRRRSPALRIPAPQAPRQRQAAA